jgi:hypothetical protein
MRMGHVVVLCSLLLVGCGSGSPIVTNVPEPVSPVPGAALTGVVSSGQQPIVGAHVYLLAASATGYGQASESLLSAAETGTSDSVGAYVTTGSSGGFSLTGDYSCSSGQQLYLYALGGNTGIGVNAAAGLMTVVGSCPSSSGPAVFATVNEVSTVAAGYALAGFATDATHVSSSGTTLAQVGVANAFANAGNLETLGTGATLATTPAGNGKVPQAEINTLANVLASCVNWSPPGVGYSPCATLFFAAGNGLIVPGDTATVAINIAHHPGANVATLYGLGSAAVFTPALTAQPNDWTIALKFTGGGLNAPEGVAIDGLGGVWVANFVADSVTKLSSSGAPVSPSAGYIVGYSSVPGVSGFLAVDASGNVWVPNSIGGVVEMSSSGTVISSAGGYTGGGLSTPTGIAIDGTGNVWIGNYSASGNNNAVFKLSGSGVGISPVTGYAAGGLNGPEFVAIDPAGNAWITNRPFSGGGSVSELSNSGSAISPSSGYTVGGINAPSGLAIDGSGNVWISDYYGALTKLSNTGQALSPASGFTGGGLALPWALAVDGLGNVWLANNVGNSLSEFSNTGLPISPATGYTGGGLSASLGMAVDGSGNVWVSGSFSNAVAEFVGAAAPVVTPLAVGVKNNTLGTRP